MLQLSGTDWYTPGEAAAIIPGASTRAVIAWAKRGDLPGCLKLPNGRWQISASAIEAMLRGAVESA
ncbi:helix-turn-helix domain-containing protein [Corynebacterium uberis]|uniref:helix-turn-helix domain-containing protein n=1 Tax=Corynebacterium TaxID=1716 RepID=UPI001D09C7AD|nr:helix-turn-helix domain-containing protein [Corynebacterium uberis]UDL76907.1 helix-turn-helix domain-containing protein [Corynebacterium uberis]UDL79118.1 helix-turn-helix domain-containing protein [Corynebacterium uberis]UDL81322.1 helix-turn-helix domain-containing protein [Corynebacterium uberis]UDL83535.1 helix-turn-helix domain-containing protein [Corynebacterium uberis]